MPWLQLPCRRLTSVLCCLQVHNQGAGQVNIYAALTYGLNQRITPSAVSLGASATV